MDRAFRTFVAVLGAVLVMLVAASCAEESGSPPPAADGTLGYDSELVAEGQERYEETCAACHGVDLEGTQTGPPFLSPIYAPNHHPDESFFAAVENGVQPHHWDFGAMPAQLNVSPEEVEAIVAYIRTTQVEAGITEDPSHP
jgi:mono/diheme cytochrome c family protein